MNGHESAAASARRVIRVFLAAEGILYLSFLFMDLTGRSDATILPKYTGILLCLLYSIYCAFRGGDRLVPAALLLTALADSLLLVLDRYYALGTGIFLGVQILYLLRIRRLTGRSLWLLRVLIPLAAAAVLYGLSMLTPLNLLAGLYFSQLLVNTIAAWSRNSRSMRCFAAGLTLFVGCDLCVAIRNAGTLFPLPMRSFARVGMWLFYLPSQVLIALSAMPSRRENTA